jgi:hypothetical protein
MKTEKLPEVPAQEAGDFYYRHLKLPYGDTNISPEPSPVEPDPTITQIMDVTSHEGTQQGFVILRNDNTVEIVDAVLGEHVRIRFGEKNRRRR